MADSRKQLTIRSGAVKRLTKEFQLYKEERDQEQSRVDKIKASGADEHDIKHAEEVLAEAGMMVPITLQRLKDSMQELATVQRAAGSEQADTEEYKDASKAIERASEVVGSS